MTGLSKLERLKTHKTNKHQQTSTNFVPAIQPMQKECLTCVQETLRDRPATYAEMLVFGAPTRDAILHQLTVAGACVPWRRQFCVRCGKLTLLIPHGETTLEQLAHTADFECMYHNMATHRMN